MKIFGLWCSNALKRGTSEGVTTLRELPAEFECVCSAKSRGFSPPRRVVVRSSLSELRCLIAFRLLNLS
jgi:hypothetical protein